MAFENSMIRASAVRDLFLCLTLPPPPVFLHTKDILFQFNQYRNQRKVVSLN